MDMKPPKHNCDGQKAFDKVMETIEDNDLDAFKEVWNAAITNCAHFCNDDCLQQEMAEDLIRTRIV